MKKIYTILVVSAVLSLLLLPFVAMPTGVLAQQTCDGFHICNPLTATSVSGLISQALTFVVNLLAIAGVIYVVWTGFMFVRAQGNPEKLTEAKMAFFHAIIGMAIILGAWAIATAISATVSKVTNNDVTLKPPQSSN